MYTPKTLKLESGATYGYDAQGNRICTGSRMGRRDKLPLVRSAPCKLRIKALKWVDGDYDQSGAYWGYTPGDTIYCAWNADGVQVFIRAKSLAEALNAVCEAIPGATFYPQ